VTRSDAIPQFLAAIQAAGLTPPEHIEPDGRLHRFPTNGKRRDDAGWYIYHPDGIPAGAFGDWRSGRSETWRAYLRRPLTTEEETAHRARMEAMGREREAEDTRRHADARARAADSWLRSEPAPIDHPYLALKGVKAHGTRVHKRELVIPVMDGEELHSLQFIGPDPDGTKRFLTGGRVHSCYFIIGEPKESLYICEGFATGASIYEATGIATAVAFYAGNLGPAAKALRARFPDLRLVICADDDHKTPDNPGLAMATAATRAVGAALAIPDFWKDRPANATDFNDLHRLCGAEAVRSCIAAAKAPGGENGGPPANDSEESRLQSIETLTYSADGTPHPRPQGAVLLDIGLNVSKALFYGDDDRSYAVIRDRSEVWGVASKRFREWLRECYFKRVGTGANSNSIRDAIETISAKAQFSGDKRKVFLRTAEADGKLYFDLTDDDWRVVEIDRDGWRVLGQSPVMFMRRGSPAALPLPEHGGSLSELWPLLNISKGARPLVAGWSLAALYPIGPFPILVIQGEEGTAKTSVARILRGLCDPAMVPLRAATRDEKDFLVGCIGNWCVNIDNLSGMQPWMSDALCRLSTGGGFAARTLYTDIDETAVQIQRPVILNGIDVGALRGDLVSRTITLTLGTILDDQRLEEDGLRLRFEKARPRILGALFTGLAQAVREKQNVKLERKPRMADFARLVVAAETALGFESGDFMAAYQENLTEGAMAALDTPVAQAVIKFAIDRRQWTGSATELLKAIASPKDDDSRSASTWPTTGRGMSAALTRLAPALRRVGIYFERGERPRHDEPRLLHLAYKPPAQSAESAEQAAASSQENEDAEQSQWDSSTEGGAHTRPVQGAAADSTGRDLGNRPKTGRENVAKTQ